MPGMVLTLLLQRSENSCITYGIYFGLLYMIMICQVKPRLFCSQMQCIGKEKIGEPPGKSKIVLSWQSCSLAMVV